MLFLPTAGNTLLIQGLLIVEGLKRKMISASGSISVSVAYKLAISQTLKVHFNMWIIRPNSRSNESEKLAYIPGSPCSFDAPAKAVRNNQLFLQKALGTFSRE